MSDVRKKYLYWVAGSVALAMFAFLAMLTRPGPSSALCSSCHVAAPAAATAAESVHADVPCLACHRRPGITGAATYLPILSTEIIQHLTGVPTVWSDLQAQPCESCHEDVTGGAILESAHPGPDAECASCHGDVSHPTGVAAVTDGHPTGYDLTHGRDAAVNPAVCGECHQGDFCMACHTQGALPHEDDWISLHGAASIDLGSEGCATCHPSSFCASCHGTEIPHADDWLGVHHRAVEGVQVAACGTCHASDDCAVCHARHSVHRDQSLYEWEPRP